MTNKEELPLCECGCGNRVTKPGNRFIHNHDKRGVTRAPEHCAALSDSMKNSEAAKAANEARRGVPHTPERCAAMSEGSKNSEDVKANADKMRGGDDLVDHHYIYDESDLSLNTVQMTRSDHTSLHNVLRGLGYIVPHINLPDEPTKETRDEVL